MEEELLLRSQGIIKALQVFYDQLEEEEEGGERELRPGGPLDLFTLDDKVWFQQFR